MLLTLGIILFSAVNKIEFNIRTFMYNKLLKIVRTHYKYKQKYLFYLRYTMSSTNFSINESRKICKACQVSV